MVADRGLRQPRDLVPGAGREPCPLLSATPSTEERGDLMPENDDDDDVETTEQEPDEEARTGEEQAAINRENDPPA